MKVGPYKEVREWHAAITARYIYNLDIQYSPGTFLLLFAFFLFLPGYHVDEIIQIYRSIKHQDRYDCFNG